MTATRQGANGARTYPGRAAVISWIFFDWAAQPYFTLITTFVFAPYFASFVAPDPASGQALWGFATAAAGLAIALLSPVLGAIADASGRRKPWIAGFGVLLVIGASAMWIGKPGDPGVIPALLLAYAIASVGVEFATVFNNAMMPTLVPPERIGRLSGTGWATGYIGGILSLVLVLGFLAANAETGRTLFGFTPLFGLDPVMHEGDRITGPLTGLWFIIFVAPMFLFTPDYPARYRLRDALGEGLRELRGSLASLPKQKSIARFLLANMIYTDGPFIPVAPLVPDGPLFAAAAERAYIVLGCLIGATGAPLQAASRSLLIRLAPKDRIAQYFGLFALTGKVTSFIGPLLIGAITAATASQKAGMAVLVVFFVVGLALLAKVRE